MFRAIPHYLNFAIISRLSTSSNRKKILVENGQVLSQHKNKIIGLQQYKISSTFKNGIYSSWTLTKRVPMLLQSIHSFNRKRKSRTSLLHHLFFAQLLTALKCAILLKITGSTSRWSKVIWIKKRTVQNPKKNHFHTHTFYQTTF